MQVRQSDRRAQLPANRGLREGLRPLQHWRPLHSDRQDHTPSSSAVDDPNPDPIFHFDAESGSGSYLKLYTSLKMRIFILLFFTAMPVYIVLFSHQCHRCHKIFSFLGQHLEIFWKKFTRLSLHLVKMDKDPDSNRQALDVAPDPDPTK